MIKKGAKKVSLKMGKRDGIVIKDINAILKVIINRRLSDKEMRMWNSI
jgi:hypothetical protein